MAHLGAPDMRHAIGYALNWPDRRALPVERLDLAAGLSLDFAAPEPARYPALGLARHVMASGGLRGAVFNAAKEAALDLFEAREIGFMDMSAVVARVMDAMEGAGGLDAAQIDLDMVLATDREARARARALA
jgi:1-deoxy-D-xylulose-5-phosphate reductoisomerase